MEDQRPKTIEHIKEVQNQINIIAETIQLRAFNHDKSKLESPEREIFDEYTPKLKNTTYGSDEYFAYLKEMKVALDHHYENNRHHPEHFKNKQKDGETWDPLSQMNLIDIIEMFCDWKAATLRHGDGDIKKSILFNQKRFNMSEQLTNILLNTNI